MSTVFLYFTLLVVTVISNQFNCPVIAQCLHSTRHNIGRLGDAVLSQSLS